MRLNAGVPNPSAGSKLRPYAGSHGRAEGQGRILIREHRPIFGRPSVAPPPDRDLHAYDAQAAEVARFSSCLRTGLRGLRGVVQAPCSRFKASRRRSEEHTSELQSLMRISYAVFCLKKKITKLITSIYRI